MLESVTGSVQICPSLVWNVIVRWVSSIPTIAPVKIVAASLARTVATVAQSKQIIAIAIFIFFMVHLRAETIRSYLCDKMPTRLLSVALRRLHCIPLLFSCANRLPKIVRRQNRKYCKDLEFLHSR